MFVCALRVNVALATILLFLVCAYGVLTGAFFAASMAKESAAATLQLTGGALLFIASMVAWWLFASLMMEAIDFPVQIPVFDLSHVIKGRSQMMKAKSSSTSA